MSKSQKIPALRPYQVSDEIHVWQEPHAEDTELESLPGVERRRMLILGAIGALLAAVSVRGYHSSMKEPEKTKENKQTPESPEEKGETPSMTSDYNLLQEESALSREEISAHTKAIYRYIDFLDYEYTDLAARTTIINESFVKKRLGQLIYFRELLKGIRKPAQEADAWEKAMPELRKDNRFRNETAPRMIRVLNTLIRGYESHLPQ